ncbi:hypothetical protein N7495_006460 [Penicillium taxi]|uniref:uncharacterized protein n=1 Tax=Penicillium taxi TaxID=168475 RepID=UPI0025451BF1|nr:uncharacterized protein N7495_006460 [Penicillium taxi]KAJ5894769.1 hypothetical protein N7495_006460 [Penicillium taxi]
MPPYPRPVSPISLESCSLPVSDIESDDLLGSDDELDEFERAAKRQRIEKIAETYLQGSQLFMLSASLRGPFDRGWKNPWQKTRKTRAETRTSPPNIRLSKNGAGYVVQETDLRQSKYREDLAADPQLQARSNKGTSFILASKSTQKRLLKQETETNESPRELKKSKRSSPRVVDEQSFAEHKSVDWLRKDKKHMSFTRFDPPSSPTPKAGHGSIDIKARRTKLHSDVPRSPTSPSQVRSPKNTTIEEQPVNSAVNGPTQQTRSFHLNTEKRSKVSPLKPEMPPMLNQATSSFRLIASTSQLPRFEYRQRYNDTSNPQVEQYSPVKNSAIPPPSEENITNRGADDLDEPIDHGSTDFGPENTERVLREEERPIQLSKSLRFADDTDYAGSSTYLQTLTEPNTYEELPSAQQIPALPGASDRIQSLHSTAVPNIASQQSSDTSHDTQPSTQAALMYAQKSFQNDLESPGQQYESPPSQLAMAHVGNDSLLAHETPLFRPDTSERALPRSFKILEGDRVQAMSTQCMIDAATPFTFSTEKKPNAARLISPKKTSPLKSRTNKSETAKARPPSRESPTNPENEDHDTFQSNMEDSKKHESGLQSDQTQLNQSTTQFTALQSLSGSIPPIVHDGQGADSFHLSQAIADAGSWLQQSFDIFKETGRPSQTGGEISSDAH